VTGTREVESKLLIRKKKRNKRKRDKTVNGCQVFVEEKSKVNEQCCKKCGTKWICKKNPPEEHELCKSCENQQTTDISSSWSIDEEGNPRVDYDELVMSDEEAVVDENILEEAWQETVDSSGEEVQPLGNLEPVQQTVMSGHHDMGREWLGPTKTVKLRTWSGKDVQCTQLVDGPVFSDFDEDDEDEDEEDYDWIRELALEPNLEESGCDKPDAVPHSLTRDQLVEDAIALASGLFPDWNEGDRFAMVQFMNEAFISGDQQYGESEAIETARMPDGSLFTIPEKAIERDRRRFEECGKDMPEMVRRLREPNVAKRLNWSRITDVISSNNPERDHLQMLATMKMKLHLPKGFVCTGFKDAPPMTATYKRLQAPVSKMFYEDFWEKDLAIVLRRKHAEGLSGLSVAVAGWTTKEAKKKGRPLTNLSAKSKIQPHAINNQHSKDMCKETCGKTKLPTIVTLIRMIVVYFNEHKNDSYVEARWIDFVLWKLDFKGAFLLLDFCPEDVEKVAIQLTEDLVMFFICGVFGWTGTPTAFDIISRALEWELNQFHMLKGVMAMYVDDMMAGSFKWHVEEDMALTKRVSTGLMGPKSLADEKEEVGPEQDWIGYHLSIGHQVVSIKRSNIKRAVYGFMAVKFENPVTIRLMQKLASWGMRYANICVYLLPLVKTLYHEYKGKSGAYSWIMSAKCRLVVRVFRALLLALGADPTRFGRKFDTFLEDPPVQTIAEYDASLSRVGCICYKVLPGGEEVPVGYASWDISWLGFAKAKDVKPSSYQNTAEFLAGVLVLIMIILLGLPREGVQLRGDSKSALNWAYTKRFRSVAAQPAALFFTLLLVLSGIQLVEPSFLRGIFNWRCDNLSRENDILAITLKDPRFRDAKKVEWDHNALMRAVHPKQDWNNEKGFIANWRNMKSIINKILQ